jgi:hypothetical protein
MISKLFNRHHIPSFSAKTFANVNDQLHSEPRERRIPDRGYPPPGMAATPIWPPGWRSRIGA